MSPSSRLTEVVQNDGLINAGTFLVFNPFPDPKIKFINYLVDFWVSMRTSSLDKEVTKKSFSLALQAPGLSQLITVY